MSSRLDVGYAKPVSAPDGWRLVRLGQVASVKPGGRRGFTKTRDYVPEGYPAYSAAGQDGRVPEWEFNQHAVVVPSIGSIGAAYAASGKWSTLANTQVIFTDPGECDHAFLAYRLDGTQFWPISGTAQPYIKPSDMPKCWLTLPPLPEQKKIAAILSSVDEAIAATQAVIEQTRRVKEGLLQDLLTRGIGHTRFKQTEIGEIPEGWAVVELEKACRAKITYGIVQCGPHLDDGVPYIRVSDMLAPELDVGGMLRTSPEIAAKFSRSCVTEGDVVYALRGKIGEVRLVGGAVAGANLTQGTARLSPTGAFRPLFMLWALRSPESLRQGDLEAKGSTFREITLARLRKLRLPRPPLAEQEAIVDRLEGVEAVDRSSSAQLDLLHHLKAGLLQDLLTGKVRVSP